MKRFKNHLLLILLSLCSITSQAYDFEVDGIYYNVLDLTERTVEVTHSGENREYFRTYRNNWSTSYAYYADSYVGNITIPATVSYKGREFTVTKIGKAAFFYQENIDNLSLPSTIQKIERAIDSDGYSIGAFVGCNFKVVKVGNTTCLNELVIGDDYYKSINPKNQLQELHLSSDFLGEISIDFSSWPTLKRIISNSNTPPVISSKATFSNAQYMGLPVYVSEESYNAYLNDAQWGKFWELRAIKQVKSVALDKTKLDLKPNETAQINAVVIPNDALSTDLKWTSSDNGVATVDQNGTVTAVGKGDAVITATATDGSGAYATCDVHVDCLVQSISLSTRSLLMEPTQSVQLSVNILPAEAFVKNVTWKSLDNGVASVDGNGKVTANNIGKTKIIVSTTDGSELSDTCEIMVLNLSSIEVGGLFYKVGNSGAVVVPNPDGTKYEGSIEIPSSITIEDLGKTSVTSIDATAFTGASKLTKIALPSTITSIQNGAFSGCKSLEFVGIENGSELSVNLDVVFADSQVKELYLGSNNITFNSSSKLLSGLKSIVIGNAVTKLPDVSVCNSTLERFVVEDGTNAISEPKDYVKRSSTLLWSQTVKNSDSYPKIYDRYSFLINIIHLNPLAQLMEGKTLKYVYFGRDVEIYEINKPSVEYANTTDSRYRSMGYMDEYLYQYQEKIAITDYKETELTSIALNKSKASLKIGDILQLNVVNNPLSVPTTNVFIWSSTNEKVATVDVFGKVTMIGSGNATITAFTVDGSNLTATCQINERMNDNVEGDVDGNGIVDISDINALINVILNLESADKYSGIDVDGNGDVDISDVNAVINIILGL